MTETKTDKQRWFDRFARWCEDIVSTPYFFLACVLIVLIWAPLFFVLPSIDTWQLLINTTTTIITFLLVSLMQNTARQSEKDTHAKLDQIIGLQITTLRSAHERRDTGPAVRSLSDQDEQPRGDEAQVQHRRRAGDGGDSEEGRFEIGGDDIPGS